VHFYVKCSLLALSAIFLLTAIQLFGCLFNLLLFGFHAVITDVAGAAGTSDQHGGDQSEA